MASTMSSFQSLLEELGHRWRAPRAHVSFWVYLLLAIILAGAIGVWVEVYRALNATKFDASGIITAIYTYFPAIAIGSAVQLIMELNKEDEKGFRSFCLLCCVIVFLLTLLFFRDQEMRIGFGFAVLPVLFFDLALVDCKRV